METYERETYVDASLEDVWEFHSRIDGLEALTPRWMGLSIREVRGPDGERNSNVLKAGSEIDMRLRPFGASAGSWTTVVTDRSECDDRALFRDEMRDGPFALWVHVHQFHRVNGGTRLRDTVHYELPGLMRATSPFAIVGFEPMFRYRHRKTKELLEG